MWRSLETSCIISSFANILSSSCGLMGFIVVGSSGGGSGSGRSACMLYHDVGISSGFNCVKYSLFCVIYFSPMNILVRLGTLVNI